MMKKYKHFISLILAVTILNYMVYNRYIFNDLYFIDMHDGLNQFYQFLEYIRENIYLNGIIPTYSLNSGIGQNFFGYATYYFYGDIFFWMLIPFKQLSSADFFIVATLIKTYIGAISMFYLLNHFSEKKHANIAFSIAYVFTGWFNLFNGRYMIFGSFYVILPLILLGLVLLIKEKKVYVYVISLALAAMMNYLYFFSIAISTFLFFTFYTFYKGYSLKETKRNFTRYIFFSFIGVCLASVILIPTVFELLNNIRSSNPYLTRNWFSLDLSKGIFYLFESKFVRMSLVSLLPLSLVYKIGDKRLRRVVIGSLLTTFLLYTSNFMYYFTIGFTYLSERWLFILIPFVLILSAIIINHIKKIYIFDYIVLLILGSLTVIKIQPLYNSTNYFIFFRNFFTYRPYIVLFIVFLSILSIALINKKHFQNLLIISVMVSIVLSFPSSYDSFSISPENQIKKDQLNSIINENKYVQAIELLKSRDQSLYRVNFSEEYPNPKVKNFPLLHNYNGFTSYTSLFDPSFYNLINTYDLPGQTTPTNNTNVGDRYSFLQVMATKYHVVIEGNREHKKLFDYRLIEEFDNGLMIYENDNYLGFGSIYSKTLSRDDFNDLRHPNLDIALLNAVTFDGAITNHEQPNAKEIHLNDYVKGNVLMTYTPDNECGVGVELGFNKLYEYYFSTDCSSRYFVFRNEFISDFGYFNEEVNRIHIDVRFKNKDAKAFVIDENIIKDLVEQRKNNSIDNFEFNDNVFKAQVNVLEDGYLQFAIPYHRGWKIKVNNQVLTTMNLNNGLLGVQLEAGKYKIEGEFIVPGLNIGILVSLITLMLLVIYFFDKKKKKYSFENTVLKNI